MDALGKAILKGREWNFLVEVSGSTDGIDRELRSIQGVDEVETRPHGWFLRCTSDVRADVMAVVTPPRRSIVAAAFRRSDFGRNLSEIFSRGLGT